MSIEPPSSELLRSGFPSSPTADAIASRYGGAIVLTMFSTKGGVGKTTLAGNLGAYLADLGWRCLLVDADPQQSLSAFFHLEREGKGGLSQFLRDEMPPRDTISSTVIERLDIVLANDVDKRLAAWVRSGASRIAALRVAIERIQSDYDFIIVDTQGSDGTGDLQELGVRAATRLLMPISPDAVVARELLTNGLAVHQRLRPMSTKDTFNVIPQPEILINGYRPRNRSHDAYRSQMRAHLQPKEEAGELRVLEIEVPLSTAYNDAQVDSGRLPVHRFDPVRRRDVRREDGIGAIPCAAESMQGILLELFGPSVMRRAPAQPTTESDDAQQAEEVHS